MSEPISDSAALASIVIFPEGPNLSLALEPIYSILNDPKGEICLVTVDGARLRVRAYVLQAHSTVFQDMLAMPNGNKSNTKENPIPLAATKEEFASLLAFATLDDVDDLSCWPTMGRVYELSEIYDFAAVRGRLKDRINLKTPDAPWETFVFAAQKRMLTLARSALTEMHWEKNPLVVRVKDIPEKEAGRLPPGYLVSYILLLTTSKTAQRTNPIDWWASVAATFKPRA